MFQAASISKPVAATGALLLVEEGKLDIDKNVNEYLTVWSVPENHYTGTEKVTLRRLLSHSAGLTVAGFRGYSATEPVPNAVQILDGVPPVNSEPVRVDIEPGSRWRCSGGGYTVIQLLVEEVADIPFAEYMYESVLTATEMENRTYEQPLPLRFRSAAAPAHGSDGESLPGGWHTHPEMAAAGLWTTPTDLTKFAISFVASFQGKGKELLDPGTVV
jgi:CubicO group peptidase (beta-lactamase class C family)